MLGWTMLAKFLPCLNLFWSFSCIFILRIWSVGCWKFWGYLGECCVTGVPSYSSSSSVWVIFCMILKEFDWVGLFPQLCCRFNDLKMNIVIIHWFESFTSLSTLPGCRWRPRIRSFNLYRYNSSSLIINHWSLLLWRLFSTRMLEDHWLSYEYSIWFSFLRINVVVCLWIGSNFNSHPDWLLIGLWRLRTKLRLLLFFWLILLLLLIFNMLLVVWRLRWWLGPSWLLVLRLLLLRWRRRLVI